MKQKVFYESKFGRTNVIKHFLLNFFFSITSYPRLSLEVFIRRRFGRGYFSLSSAIIYAVPLAVGPYFVLKNLPDGAWSQFFECYVTWYLYLFAFAYKSWKHYLEIRLKPGEFDFTKYSRYGGDQHSLFFEIPIFGEVPTPRFVATILEPAFFLIIGIVLLILRQPIGYLFTLNAIIYSLGYFGAYHLGDIYLQEIIDNLIITEELKDITINGKYPDADKGFELFNMPVDPEHRRKMAEFVTAKDEPLQAY